MGAYPGVGACPGHYGIILLLKMFGYSMDMLFPEAVNIITEYEVDRDQVFMNGQYIYSCMLPVTRW